MDWLLCKAIDLPSTAVSETNYNYRIVVTYEAEMLPDFSDISFVEEDGVTEVEQYRFSYNPGVSSVWWIKIASKPAAGKKIYMLYSNAGAILRSDGDSTFEFKDEGDETIPLGEEGKWEVHQSLYDLTYRHDGYIEVNGYIFGGPGYSYIQSLASFSIGRGMVLRALTMDTESVGYTGISMGFLVYGGADYQHLNLDQFAKYFFRTNVQDGTLWVAEEENEITIQRNSSTQISCFENGVLKTNVSDTVPLSGDLPIALYSAGWRFRIFDIFVYHGQYEVAPTQGTSTPTIEIWPLPEDTMLNEFIDDISFRIQNPMGQRWQYYPHIQRTLQRLYWRLNKEYRLVKDSLAMDFSTLSPFVASWALPRWFMKLYKLDPDFDWREPDEFDPTESSTYTINAGRIYFGGIDATSVVTMYFYSSGKKFVVKATVDLLTDECNEPEWTDRSLDQALYYGACIELKTDYPGFNHDVNEYNEMKRRMADSFDSEQDKDMILPGDPAEPEADSYGWVN